MNREQYTEMLHTINKIHKANGDVHKCIAEYRQKFKYVYFYNDTIIKLILGNPENEKITANLFNAILKLDGASSIDNLTFVNPSVDSVLCKSITSDIVAQNKHLERIVMEVQHVEDETYNDRLVFYTAKHTMASLAHGQGYLLHTLNLISLQMFDGFPESKDYLHSVRLKNQENKEFFKKQTITLVEVPKFLKGDYASDNSLLAQWLRFVDSLNNEKPLAVPEDSIFAQLQKKMELSIFTEEFLVHEAMAMSDREYELYVEKKHARKEGLEEGRAEGRAEGREEGFTEGCDATISILRSLGVSDDKIAEAEAQLKKMGHAPQK